MNNRIVILSSVAIVAVISVIGLAKFASNDSAATQQPFVSDLVLSTSHRIGPDSAKVTVVEFGDYQCPTCASVAPMLKQIQGEHPDQVALVYRYFPLPMHNNAIISAHAAEAAALQGKFWQMHELLFSRQDQWAEQVNPRTIFNNYARELGLDVTKFDQDMDSQDVIDAVNTDKAAADSLGLSGTPSIFINGQAYTGNLNQASLTAAITKPLED